MAKLPRKTQKIFCSKPTSENQTSVFGTMKTADKQYSTDVGTLQSNAAYEQGWKSATIASYKPFMEDFNTLNYINTSQLAYLFQQGIPEWDEATAYYKNSFCSYNGDLWQSLIDDNLGNAPFEGDEWALFSTKNKGGGLELCDIGTALYVDETKGLRRILNGGILDITFNYKAFLTRLLKIKTTNPDYFTTEENWQAEKTMNIDGCVYKFVLNYDSTGTNVISVRLPKYPDYVEINNNSINNTAPVAVYGNGRGLGLVDSVNSPTYRTLIDYSYPNNIEGLVPGNLTFDHNTVFPVGTNTSNQSGYIRNVFWGVSQNANTSGLAGTATITSNFRQTKLKMRYFIQIATGQETENNITNEIELNNPSFFGDSKYVSTKVNNLSWLKSEGQNNPKGTYPSFYDWILENVNKGTKNFKGKKLYQFKGNTTETEGYAPSCSTRNPVVGTWFYGYDPIQPFGYATQVNSDGSIVIHDTKVNKDFTLVYNQEIITLPNLLTDYDFYIDTDNETFRLPLLNGSENKLGKFEPIPLPAFGSDFSNPYVNGMYEVFASKSTNDGYLYIANRTTAFEDDNNTQTDGWGRVFCPSNLGDTIFIGTNIAEGGERFARYAKYIGNGTLYYYVGETVQNANLIDAGRIGEILPTKLDASKVKAYIVETYRNGYSWYRIYSDGWCEQGGLQHYQGSPYGLQTVTLLKPYIDTNYTVTANIVWGTDWFTNTSGQVNCASSTDVIGCITNRTKSSFDIQRLSSHFWKAEGYIA